MLAHQPQLQGSRDRRRRRHGVRQQRDPALPFAEKTGQFLAGAYTPAGARPAAVVADVRRGRAASAPTRARPCISSTTRPSSCPMPSTGTGSRPGAITASSTRSSPGTVTARRDLHDRRHGGWGWARAVPFVLGDDPWATMPHLKRLVDEINARPAAVRVRALKEKSSRLQDGNGRGSAPVSCFRRTWRRSPEASSARGSSQAGHSTTSPTRVSSSHVSSRTAKPHSRRRCRTTSAAASVSGRPRRRRWRSVSERSPSRS